MNKRKTTSIVLVAAGLLLGSAGGLTHPTRAGAAGPVPPTKGPSKSATPAEALTATTFAQYQGQIKPQPGESRWQELPWFIDLHAARRKAAAEGKPLFVYSAGGGSTAIGLC